jgi:hypothetical protein
VGGDDVIVINPDFERQRAETAIDEKWRSLGSAPGEPRVPGRDGVRPIGDGFYREYANGRIYFRRRGPHPPYWVYGAIGDRYSQMGGPQGGLGWPTSDEQPFAQDGRATTFEHGTIYWWADTGAIELGNVAVRYTGLLCFAETDWDQGPGGSDEPYVVFGTVPPPPAEPSVARTAIYEDVDAGGSRTDTIELFRGLPYGLTLTAQVMEHDFGNPDAHRDTVATAVDTASDVVKGAAEGAAGPLVAKLVEIVLSAVRDDLVEAINDALDTDDDHIGTVPVTVTAKQMVTLARYPRQEYRGVPYHIQSDLIADDGAAYKVCFDVQAV